VTDDLAADSQAVNKIIPQNLTANAAYNVAGNPPSTRPESGVANCFPGLNTTTETSTAASSRAFW
jgi:hypothetical protein